MTNEPYIIKCICGAFFIDGNPDKALDQHFRFDCPVYREARRKLEERTLAAK